MPHQIGGNVCKEHFVSQPNSVISVPRPGQAPIEIGNDRKLTMIAGPCQLESRQHGLEVSAALREIADRLDVGLIYKTSYDKANRTSLSGKRGMGLEASLPVFNEIRETTGLPVLTDVHTEEHVRIAAEAVDVLQIPAFLCRQTDLLIAAAQTGKVINVKKGQFLAPWDMKNVLAKVVESGNPNVMACERGASFGYNTLVTDMRALPIMASSARRSCLTPRIRCNSRAARGVFRRTTRIRAAAGACGCVDRCGCRLHGNPSGPGQCAVGWSQHGAVEPVRGIDWPPARIRRSGQESLIRPDALTRSGVGPESGRPALLRQLRGRPMAVPSGAVPREWHWPLRHDERYRRANPRRRD